MYAIFLNRYVVTRHSCDVVSGEAEKDQWDGVFHRFEYGGPFAKIIIQRVK